jgi:hypothetical protein
MHAHQQQDTTYNDLGRGDTDVNAQHTWDTVDNTFGLGSIAMHARYATHSIR